MQVCVCVSVLVYVHYGGGGRRLHVDDLHLFVTVVTRCMLSHLTTKLHPGISVATVFASFFFKDG